MKWVYMAALVFTQLQYWLNAYPMLAKARVMSGKAGNLRANMYVYKVYDPAGERATQPVVLQEEGDVGVYNRSNRSLHHFTENMAAFAIGIYLVGVVFPVPCFVLTCTYALGRVMHQVGYSVGGYGKHGFGYAVLLVSQAIMQGFLILIVIKCFNYNPL